MNQLIALRLKARSHVPMPRNSKCHRRASRQHWVLSRDQAVADGVPPRAIDRLLRNGEWRRIYPGVYLVNQAPLSWKARLMGAILWAGPGAVASHRSAAALLGLKHGDKGRIEISSPRRLNSRHGIRVHLDPSLATRPHAHADNIPLTRIVWTVLDLCAVLTYPAATAVVVDVVRRQLVSVLDLSRVLDESAGRRGGRRTLSRVLMTRFALGVTDSDAEDLFIDLAGRRGLHFRHHFVVQDPSFRAELDFADVSLLLDIEVDGGKAHDDDVAQQWDKNRDAELISRGWTVLRFTYWDLIQRPDWVFERIGDTLARLRGTTRSGDVA